MSKVLDFGYVRHVESWGHGNGGINTTGRLLADDMECGIIEAARQSTQASFRGWDDTPCSTCNGIPSEPQTRAERFAGREHQVCQTCEGKGYLPGDARLLKFLFTGKPQHATPFEFSGMTIEVQAPLFVFREWHRHRTQSYNEMSARYAPMPDTHYIPTLERCMMGKGTTNKQAGAIKGASELTIERAELWREALEKHNRLTEELYQLGLESGLPKELARLPVSVNRYSRMRASANLRNWLAFLTLRSDPAAQWEIQMFANAVGEIVATQFPRTWKLFCERRGV